MKATLGVVGLGMGSAIAEALLERGYEVVGYDVLPAARLASACVSWWRNRVSALFDK